MPIKGDFDWAKRSSTAKHLSWFGRPIQRMAESGPKLSNKFCGIPHQTRYDLTRMMNFFHSAIGKAKVGPAVSLLSRTARRPSEFPEISTHPESAPLWLLFRHTGKDGTSSFIGNLSPCYLIWLAA